MELTKSEENYLKALFQIIVDSEEQKAGTNQVAEHLGLSAASVNNMLKKLRTKGLVAYEKYGKLELTEAGESIAVRLIRKHRLWETFLYKHMSFSWDEVHEVAEQLEHIKSPKLIAELDKFLGFPEQDPHGAIIPTAKGDYNISPKVALSSLKAGDKCRLVSVKDSSVELLQYVSRIGLALNSEMLIEEIQAFDHSMTILFEGKSAVVSKKFGDHVFVEKIA